MILTKQRIPAIMSVKGFDEKKKNIFIFNREDDNDPCDVAEQAQMTGVCHAIGLCKKDTEQSYSVDTFADFLNSVAYGTMATEYTYFLCCNKYTNDKLTVLLDSLGFRRVLYWQPFRDKKQFDRAELTEMLRKQIAKYETTDKSQLDKERFHLSDNKGNPTSPFDYAICEDIKQNYHIFVCGYEPYIYDQGVYKIDKDGIEIKSIIKKYLYERFTKARIINQIYNLLFEDKEIRKDFEDLNKFPSHWICFQDCMLDVKTMQEIPHNPKYYCINQVPWMYSDVKKSVSKGYFDKYAKESIPDPDDLKMLLQFSGYCLTRATEQQKFLLLTGEGGTGKSQIITMVQTAVGNKNCSHVALQNLSQRFQSSSLVGKLLNCCADLPLDAMEDISVLKMAIGEDDIQTERKGQESFSFRNYAKLLFSANSVPPATGERTNAFYRRLYVLKMNTTPKQIDVNLSEKLKEDIHYFIKLALNELHESYSMTGILFESENSKQAVRQARKDADVVQAWLDDECTIGTDMKMSRSEAFLSFEKYCDEEGRMCLTKNNFYRALRQKKFVETKIQGYQYFRGATVGKNLPLNCPQEDEKLPPNGFLTISDEELKSIPFD